MSIILYLLILIYNSLYEEFIKCMHSESKMSMMKKFNYFIGLQIKQTKEDILVNQKKYIRDSLKRFKIEDAKTIATPMSSSIKFDKDEQGIFIDHIMYRHVIDSLIYLITSEAYIIFFICLCAKF